MITLKALKSERATATELYALVRGSQEISVMQMQKIRGSVLDIRKYMDGLIDVFATLRSNDQRSLDLTLSKSKQESQLHPKKSVVVFLSPSSKFAGALMPQLLSEFERYQLTPTTDIIVVGSVGKELFDQRYGSSKKYTYIDLDLNTPDKQKISQFLSTVFSYDHVDVCSARFQSLVEQVPKVVNINGYDPLITTGTKKDSAGTTEMTSFLFEPSLSELIAFFEVQIAASLLRQAINESRLALLGSRITALEGANSTIEEHLKVLSRKHRQIKKRVSMHKQQSRVAGSSLWSR